MPITAVRRRYSATVVRPTPTERAIVRTLAPHASLSRKTSRTFRIDNLSAGIASPLVGATLPVIGSSTSAPKTPPQGVRDQSESLSGLRRNQWPPCVGMTVRLGSESAGWLPVSWMMTMRVPVQGPGHEWILSRLARAGRGSRTPDCSIGIEPRVGGDPGSQSGAECLVRRFGSPLCDVAFQEHLDHRRDDGLACLLCVSRYS